MSEAKLHARTEAAEAAPIGIVRGFNPGWYGAVMGTAIVGVGAYLNPGSDREVLTAAHDVGLAFVILAWAEAAALLVPYLMRLLRHRDAALADLSNPVLGPLYGTFPGALLVLATATATVGPSLISTHAIVVTVAVLASFGAAITLALGVAFTYFLFIDDGPRPDAANGGWFIPPVANIVIPLPLLVLLGHVDAPSARLLLLLGYASLGIGLVLFILVAVVLFSRLIFHPLPHAQLAPSLWIGLGPIGVGTLAILRLSDASKPFFGAEAAAIKSLSTVTATVLWGFGLWWLATAAALLVRYLRQGPLPYGIGLWAFTFPLGAYTVGTFQLGKSWESDPVMWGAAGLLVLLAVFWFTVAARTAKALVTGQAWER